MIWIPIAVLTVAIAFLFAMMAELAARVKNGVAAAPAVDMAYTASPTRVDLSASTVQPVHWPGGDADDDSFDVLILSTLCASCHHVAEQLRNAPPANRGVEVRIVISTSGEPLGAGFVDQYDLHEYVTYVDPGGKWCRTTFGISLSPLLIRVRNGRLGGAYTIYDLPHIADVRARPEPRVVSLTDESTATSTTVPTPS